MSDTQELTAGREMDVEILRKVFGVKKVFRPCDVKQNWTSSEDYHYIPSGKPPRTHMLDAMPVPSFSTWMPAAWAVVNAWVDKRPAAPQSFILRKLADGWLAQFHEDDNRWWSELADAAPEAICKAALKATAALTEQARGAGTSA